MYFCRHCLSLFLSTIQWVWLLDFVSYKIHIFICSRIFKLIFVFQQNLHVESSRVPTFYTWSSYQPNNDLSCICCCFTKNGNKSWSTKQKQKKYADTFGGTVLIVQWHYAMQTKKSTMCSTVFDLWPIYQNVFIPLQRQICTR